MREGAGAGTAEIAAARSPAGGTPGGPTGGSGPARPFTFSIMRVYSPGGTGGVGTSRVVFSDGGGAGRVGGGEGVKGSFLAPTACLSPTGAGGGAGAGLSPSLSAPGLATGGATLGRSAIGIVGAVSSRPVPGPTGTGAVMIPD